MEMSFDLTVAWAGLLAAAVFIYVALDGFDLGVGILYPLFPEKRDRDTMMNSLAPVWDGNETWLILGGGGLFAAFPMAYAILMPALYVPVLAMLLALVFRGVAFEFRWRASRPIYRKMWDGAFFGGWEGGGPCLGASVGWWRCWVSWRRRPAWRGLRRWRGSGWAARGGPTVRCCGATAGG